MFRRPSPRRELGLFSCSLCIGGNVTGRQGRQLLGVVVIFFVVVEERISRAPRKIAPPRRTPQNCPQMIPLRSRSDSFTFTPGLLAIARESNFSRCPLFERAPSNTPPSFRMRSCRTVHLRAPRALWRRPLSADSPSVTTYAGSSNAPNQAAGHALVKWSWRPFWGCRRCGKSLPVGTHRRVGGVCMPPSTRTLAAPTHRGSGRNASRICAAPLRAHGASTQQPPRGSQHLAHAR
jgi:hypothetical protein